MAAGKHKSGEGHDTDKAQVRAWDRIGAAMGAAGEVGQAIARRNFELWNRVAENLRKDHYGADEMAEDAAKAIRVAGDNIRDMWTVAVAPPLGPGDAGSVPNRWIFFDPYPSDQAESGFRYAATADIEPLDVPPRLQEGRPPVRIMVARRQKPPAERRKPETTDDKRRPKTTEEKLEHCLKAEYFDEGRKLCLIPQNVPDLNDDEFEPGLYHGVVYSDGDTRPRPITELSIVVRPLPATEEKEVQSAQDSPSEHE